MPDLLLSSAPVKDSSLNSMVGGAKITQVVPGQSVSHAESKAKGEGGFNNLFSSIVNPKLENYVDSTNENDLYLDKSLEELSVFMAELNAILRNSEASNEAFGQIRDFLNGQDLSFEGLKTLQTGGTLPEMLSQLESMLKDGAELNAVNLESLEFNNPQSLDGHEAVFAQIMQAAESLNVILKKPENSKESKPALLSFAFNNQGESAKGNSWQQYDPQQLSQSLNGNSLSQEGSLDTQFNGMKMEPLTSKSDQSFQFQMEQLASGNAKDISNSLTDTTLESLIDVKDKAATKFSDLQLRTSADSLKQYSTTLSTPVNSQDWGDEVSQKIVWFTGRNIQAAEMHLNPAELGPIDVKINVQNDIASVTFNVSNPSVRDLLESNVVRLREMMEANGVNVGDVNVDAGSQEQSQGSGEGAGRDGVAGTGSEGDDPVSDEQVSEQIVSLKETNLVDYFV